MSCKHCGKSFEGFHRSEKANHSRWCLKNPKRKQYVDNLKHVRAQISETARKAANAKIKQMWKDGKYSHLKFDNWLGKKHTEESKKKMSESARKLTHRRLRKGTVRYKGILLDSSWELALAKRLDEINIRWIRPKPIKWIDKKGLERNYFPDFYLPDYDLYLDPKNEYAFKNQSEKIECLKEQLTNLVFLRTLKECETYSVV